MNVAALLQDSPSEEFRARQDRDKAKERERELERERERERDKGGRGWGERERERDLLNRQQRPRALSSASHTASVPVPNAVHSPLGAHPHSQTSTPIPPQIASPIHQTRAYEPLNNGLSLRPSIHSYDGKPPPPPPPPSSVPPLTPRSASSASAHTSPMPVDPSRPPSHLGHSHPGHAHGHTRSYSHDGRPPSSGFPSIGHAHAHNLKHAHAQSQPMPLSHSPSSGPFMSPREGERSGLPGQAFTGPITASPTEFPPGEYTHRERGERMRERRFDGVSPPSSHPLERESDHQLQRSRSTASTSSAPRPRSPPYPDLRERHNASPSTSRPIHPHAVNAHPRTPPLNQPYSGGSHTPQHSLSPTQSHPSHGHTHSPMHKPSLSIGSSRWPGPPSVSMSLPPPPSAAIKHGHDGQTSTSLAVGRGAFVDEFPPNKRPMASVVSAHEKERTLKEDIEREKVERGEQERQREWQRERAAENAMREHARSGSLGVVTPRDRQIEREADLERDRMAVDDAGMDARGQPRNSGPPREREGEREREPPHHHHHHHHHHTTLSQSQIYQRPHSSGPNISMQQQQQQHLSQQHAHHQHQHVHPPPPQAPSPQEPQRNHVPPTAYTYAHTGKPRLSRSGVLKLAPPGVTVSNVAPSTSDITLQNASGVIMRPETLTLAPAELRQLRRQEQQQQGGQNHLSLGQTEFVSRGGSQSGNIMGHGHGQMAMDNTPSPPIMFEFQSQPQSQSTPQPALHPEKFVVEAQRVPSPHPTQQQPGPGVPPGMGGVPSIQQQMLAQQHSSHFPHHSQKSLPTSTSHPHSAPMHPNVQRPPNQPPPPPNGIPPPGSHGYQLPHHPGPYHNLPPQHHMAHLQPHTQVPFNEIPTPPVPMALQPKIPPEPNSSEPPLSIGTFIYPRTPFPYFFPDRTEETLQRNDHPSFADVAGPSGSGSPAALKKQHLSQPRKEADSAVKHTRATHTTILIPSSHLPASLPSVWTPALWGGGREGPSPAQDPWYYTPVKRVYTDDSSLPLCALHAGRISWAGLRRAREVGLDLCLKLSLHRNVGKFIGGMNAFCDGGGMTMGMNSVDVGLPGLLMEMGESLIQDEERTARDGEELMVFASANWESGHDGCGVEVVSAEWLPKGYCRKQGRKNRAQRLKEYAERQKFIFADKSFNTPTSSVLGKRQAREDGLSPVSTVIPAADREPSDTRTVVFGGYSGKESLGFKYDPISLKSIITPLRGARRKRRKAGGNILGLGNTLMPDEEYCDMTIASDTKEKERLAVILENGSKRFVLVSRHSSNRSRMGKNDDDKENRIMDDVSEGGCRGGRFDLFELSVSSGRDNLTLASKSKSSEKEKKRETGPEPPLVMPVTPMSAGNPSPTPPISDDPTAKTIREEPTTQAKSLNTDMPTPPATTEMIKEKERNARVPTKYGFEANFDKMDSISSTLVLRDIALSQIHFKDLGIVFDAVLLHQSPSIMDGVLEERTDSNGNANHSVEGTFVRVERWRMASRREKEAVGA